MCQHAYNKIFSVRVKQSVINVLTYICKLDFYLELNISPQTIVTSFLE